MTFTSNVFAAACACGSYVYSGLLVFCTYFRMPSSHEFSITRNAYIWRRLLQNCPYKTSTWISSFSKFVHVIFRYTRYLFTNLCPKVTIRSTRSDAACIFARFTRTKSSFYKYYFFNKSFVLLVILWTCKKVRSRPMHHRSLWKDDKN